MENTLLYIDNYFNGLLTAPEKKIFEERCEKDESFAGEVAEYITSREAVRNELLEQKRSAWRNPDTVAEVPMRSPAKVFTLKPWVAIAAAACVIGILFLVIPFTKNDPQQFASAYIEQNFRSLSKTMDGSKDSLQAAINKYNQKEFDSARSIFQALYNRDHTQLDALKYSGLTYLMQNKYAEAIACFDDLAAKENLFSNPGLFFKAVTLLKRNTGADKETAKMILQEVVDKNLEESRQAAEWLKDWR